jgi:hypothetical protein
MSDEPKERDLFNIYNEFAKIAPGQGPRSQRPIKPEKSPTGSLINPRSDAWIVRLRLGLFDDAT